MLPFELIYDTKFSPKGDTRLRMNEISLTSRMHDKDPLQAFLLSGLLGFSKLLKTQFYELGAK